jgi:chloramphenicol-sensitive protein RarD
MLLVLSSALLGVQLWIFMWAPMNGRALPVSLGYFLLPLVMVVAGRVLFAERLTLGQSLATLVAAAGVAHEFWQAGGMSWETWVVALGYTVYFSLRRWLQTDTLAGHWIDMALLVPVAIAFTLRTPDSWPLVAGHPTLWGLLPLLGIVSAVALALYMIASRWLPLGLFGLLSYVEPALLVVVAWLLGEHGAAAATELCADLCRRGPADRRWLAAFMAWAFTHIGLRLLQFQPQVGASQGNN